MERTNLMNKSINALKTDLSKLNMIKNEILGSIDKESNKVKYFLNFIVFDHKLIFVLTILLMVLLTGSSFFAINLDYLYFEDQIRSFFLFLGFVLMIFVAVFLTLKNEHESNKRLFFSIIDSFLSDDHYALVCNDRLIKLSKCHHNKMNYYYELTKKILFKNIGFDNVKKLSEMMSEQEKDNLINALIERYKDQHIDHNYFNITRIFMLNACVFLIKSKEKKLMGEYLKSDLVDEEMLENYLRNEQLEKNTEESIHRYLKRLFN